jgi:hypothetical protein
MTNLTGAGYFENGNVANPGGRPKSDSVLKLEARKHGREMIQVLVTIARDKSAPPAARVASAREILDRGYGKPETQVDVKLEARKYELLLEAKFNAMSDEELLEVGDRYEALKAAKAVEAAMPTLIEAAIADRDNQPELDLVSVEQNNLNA